LAASTVAMPANLNSLGSRSSVWNTRSDRPHACGESAAICSIPSWLQVRPT
jgi:hypothetical protein